MMRRALLGFLVSLVFVSVPRWGAAFEDAKPLANQQFAQGFDDLGRELREWFGRWGEYFGSGTLEERGAAADRFYTPQPRKARTSLPPKLKISSN